MRRQSNRSVWALKWDKMVTGKSEYTELFFVLFFFFFGKTVYILNYLPKKVNKIVNSGGKSKWKCQSLSLFRLCNPKDGLLCPWDSLGRNTGVGSHSLSQGIFLTQGSNPGLLHYKQIIYGLSHWRNQKEIIQTWEQTKVWTVVPTSMSL